VKKTTGAKEWLAALQEFRATNGAEQVPPDFLTREQIAELWGVCSEHARRNLKRMLATGRLEKKMFRRPTQMGVRPVPHYRLCRKSS